MLISTVKKIFGTRNDRELKRMGKVVARINALEESAQALDDAALKAKTAEFRLRLGEGESLDQLLPEAFAVVREAGVRALAARVPPGLRGLALNFTGCLIGEGGAQAVAARVPAGLRSLSLNFLGHH